MEQCRCLAAQRGLAVRLIAQESALVGITAQRTWFGDAHAFAVQQQVLRYRAEVRANESAAAALDLLLRLSEAERLELLLKLAVPQFDEARKDIQTLRRQGLLGAQDATELDRYRIQLDEQQRLVDASVVQAGAQLRYLLGMDPAHGPRIHPVLEGAIATVTAPIDVEQAIATGLAMRPDLNLLRMLIGELDFRTLPFALGALQHVESSAGVPPAGSPLLALLKRSCNDTAVEIRRSQLVTLLQDLEQASVAEIRRAVETVATEVQQMRLAEQTIGTWLERLKDVDRHIKEGTATPLDLSTSRLRLLEARSNLVKHATEARIAEIRLREAQGILATGCCGGPPAVGAPAIP
jgi:outer membrane protein TolC